MDVVQKRKHQPIENTVNMQLNCLIGVTVARSEHASKIVPGLSKKAHKGMETLSPVFFRIITFLGSMLLPKDRGYMGVDIHCASIKIFETLSHTTKQMSIYTRNVLSLVYRDLVEILAYGALGREPAKPCYLLANLVCCQFLHVAWPENTEHKTIKQTNTHLKAAVIILASLTHSNYCQNCFQIHSFKEPSKQSYASEPCEVLSCEFFLWDNALVFSLFFVYIFLHLFGASFLLVLINKLYTERRLFSLKISWLFYYFVTSQ